MGNIKIVDDDHWHAIRAEHVGGSEIASLFYEVELPTAAGQPPVVEIMSMTDPMPEGARPLNCLSPYKSGYRLWLEKAGQLKPAMVEGERIDAGTFLESGLAAWAMKKWEDLRMRKVRRYMTHEIIGGWGSTLDYETITGLRPVEFKNVDGMIYRDQWAETDGAIDAPPLHINLQLQAQLGVSGRDEGEIIACVGGNELKRGTFKLHALTQEKIGKAIAQFWLSVRNGKPPLAFADIDTAAEFYRYGTKDRAVEIEDPVLDKLCGDYLLLKTDIDRKTKLSDMIAGRLAIAMGVLSEGAATRATTAGHSIVWPVVLRPAQMYPARWSDEITYRQGLRITLKKK